MSNLILLSLLLGSFASLAQTYEQFAQQIAMIEKYKDENKDLKSKLDENVKKIGTFSNNKMLEKDKELQSKLLGSMEEIAKSVDNKINILSTGSAPQKLQKLREVRDQRQKYLDYEKKYAAIKSENGHSKRMQKYINLIDQGKYGLAKALRLILPKRERAAADQFRVIKSYLTREGGIQDSLDKNIKDLTQKVKDSLAYPLSYIDEIEAKKKEAEKVMDGFESLKLALKFPTFDVEIDHWGSGGFGCSEKAKLVRFKNYPNLIGLSMDGDLRSVIDVSKTNSKTPHYAYVCKKRGKYTGGCLEDRKKKLCEIDSTCKDVLEQMEKAYNEGNWFPKIKNDFYISIFQQEKNDVLNGKTENLLSILKEQGKLGKYTIEQYYAKMEYAVQLIKDINNKSPEETVRRLKLKFAALEKSELAKVTDERTKTAIRWIYATIGTNAEALLNDSKKQKYLSQNCNEYENSNDFCTAYGIFDTKSKQFDDRGEIVNLAQNECSRIVLRYQKDESGNVEKYCGYPTRLAESIKEVEDLNEDVEKIIEFLN